MEQAVGAKTERNGCTAEVKSFDNARDVLLWMQKQINNSQLATSAVLPLSAQ
jgi:hypothetical protein